jgi:hypothetical protein
VNLSSRVTAVHVASLVTAINVLVASVFSLAGIVSPQSILRAHFCSICGGPHGPISRVRAGCGLQTLRASVIDLGRIGRRHATVGLRHWHRSGRL